MEPYYVIYYSQTGNTKEMAEAVGGVKSGEFTGRLWMLDNRKMFNHGRTVVEPKADLIK